MYNSFRPSQLDDMVHSWIEEGWITSGPSPSKTCGGGMHVYQCHYSTNTHKYSVAGLRTTWIKKWKAKGYFVPEAKTQVLVHVIWWRWANQYKLLDAQLEISHLWKDHNEILYLCQESPDMNESRKYCMLFDWWHPDKPERCNHHPKCWGNL